MYSFQTGKGKRRNKTVIRVLIVLIFVLVVALAAVIFVYAQSRSVSGNIQSALLNRAISEVGNADAAIKALTQSSGTNTNSLLASVRSHLYALQSLNMLAANIYGPGTEVADSGLLADCMLQLDTAEKRMQAGNVIAEQTSNVRNNIALLVAAFDAVR